MRKIILMILFVMFVSGTAQAEYQLVWSDEFNLPDGSIPDPANWENQVMSGRDTGNNELQYYLDSPSNSWIENGNLVIEVRKESYRGYQYTSARLTSRYLRDFKYGRMEARIKLPYGQGLWPAFWMFPTDEVYGGWAASGEIDIMESVNEMDSVYGTIHFGGSYPDNVSTGTGFTENSDNYSSDYHIYTFEWEANEMRWFCDGYLFLVLNDWYTTGYSYPAPYDQLFHFILNVAVGGPWAGNPDDTLVLPQRMYIDWVRVYDTNFNKCPIVTISSPLEWQSFPSGSNVSVEASASDTDGSVTQVEFFLDGQLIATDTSSPYTCSTGSLSTGCYKISARALDNGGYRGLKDAAYVYIDVGGAAWQAPFYGTPMNIPGKIQVEDFDAGVAEKAYHDASPGNVLGAYRTDTDVDIEACTDTDGGYNIGYSEPGDWTDYQVNVQYSGTYDVIVRNASLDTGGTVHVDFNGVDKTGPITFPKTGGWQTWQSTTKTGVYLSAGQQEMTFVLDAKSWEAFNINYVEFVYTGGGTTTTSETTTTTSETTTTTSATTTTTSATTTTTSATTTTTAATTTTTAADCLERGEACADDAECCSGNCLPNGVCQ